MSALKTSGGDTATIAYIVGTLPDGVFIPGLPADGTPVTLPADDAAVFIKAGVARPAGSAAPAAVAAVSDDGEEIDNA